MSVLDGEKELDGRREDGRNLVEKNKFKRRGGSTVKRETEKNQLRGRESLTQKKLQEERELSFFRKKKRNTERACKEKYKEATKKARSSLRGAPAKRPHRRESASNMI